MAAFASGCVSMAATPKLGLQRSLYPGLGDVDPSEIDAAFRTEVSLRAPLSGGIVWLEGGRSSEYGPSLSEYIRTGTLERAVEKLTQAPFDQVAALPTTTDFQRRTDGPPPIDTFRGAAAKFQYDVAFILQTAIAEESGINPFAIGYLGLITAPLFPGTDISVAAGAEVCAVDVRSGVMLGCGIGRAHEEARFVFPLRISSRSDDLRERMVALAVEAAAADVVAQIARRIAR